MKLTKADIGKTVIVVSWRRGREPQRGTSTITSVGRTRMGIGGVSHKLIESNEFMMKLTTAHASDRWIKVYFTEKALEDSHQFDGLVAWFYESLRGGDYKKLTLSQLKQIQSIVLGNKK